MKYILSSLIGASCLLSSASGAILFFDLGSVTIPHNVSNPSDPVNFTGIYINILTQDVETEEPLNFNDGPWLNFFAGGLSIANSDKLRPWASADAGSYNPDTETGPGHYFFNLPQNTVIDGNGQFVGGEAVSFNHLGPLVADSLPNRFQSQVRGYLAFAYDTGAGDAYGWLSFTPNDSGDGISFDLAYSDIPGEALTVGAIPEPASFAVIAGFIGLALTVFRRRRS
jgi:hypothetical protein